MLTEQRMSFHSPPAASHRCAQFSLPPELLGSPPAHEVWSSGVLSLHTNVPSSALSDSPIHQLPGRSEYAVLRTSSCDAWSWIETRCPPWATQSNSAAA